MVYNFSPLFQTLYLNSDSFTSLRIGFMLLLAGQIGFYYDYVYPVNYLDRAGPPFLPFLPQYLLLVPDNACMRSRYGYPIAFDYIVVGSGAAGSVIASRLSENASVSVLIIEAGDDPAVESVAPLTFPFNINNTRVWMQHMEVDDASANGFKNGLPAPYGKQWGGSTGTNAMLYVCGNDRDYDSWAGAGNNGWDYSSIRQYFKKSEDNTDQSIIDYKSGAYHAAGGGLTVSSNILINPVVGNIRTAFSLIGYKLLRDYNSQEYNGYVQLQSTIRNGERCSGYRAFLSPAKNRTNLTFMKNSLVTNVVFDKLSPTTVIGVNVRTNSPSCPNIFIRANKEVILSAGGYGSPKILMQSGIGKPEDLTPLGITPKVNLSVGDNFQDHAISPIFIKINPGAPNQTIADMVRDSEKYFYNRTGNFSQLSISSVQGFINTLDVNATYPDIQLSFYHVYKNQEDLATACSNYGFKDEYTAKIVETNLQFELLAIYVVLLNPTARGTVKLRGSDPNLTPKITSNFFKNSADVATMLRGINKLQAVVNTQAMQDVSAAFLKFDIEECDREVFATDPYWSCYIKYMSQSLWHPVGTCKMGNSSDPGAVVNEKLQVYGTSRLRVADASIMPTIATGNTQCPTYMIGEKAADMIKAA